MSATFAAPVASVMLAVELLLFEWKPRSLIPVALASVTAAAMRRYVLGVGPLFPVPRAPASIGAAGACRLRRRRPARRRRVGAPHRKRSTRRKTRFAQLPIHWMWWPAIGGLVIGIGGYVFPQALGVGYDVIGVAAAGQRADCGSSSACCIVKSTDLGGLARLGHLGRRARAAADDGRRAGRRSKRGSCPFEGAGFWPLVSMGAMLGGTMRAPLTGVIFALELTHDVNMLLPLLLASTIAHGFTVLVLKRSILTEKISRRGYHLSREYAVDPLEIIFAREVVRTAVAALPADATARRASRPRCTTRTDAASAAAVSGRRCRPAAGGRRSRAAGCGSGWTASATGEPRALREMSCTKPEIAYRRRAAARDRVPDGGNRRDAAAGRRARQPALHRDGRADRPADGPHAHPRRRAATRARPRRALAPAADVHARELVGASLHLCAHSVIAVIAGAERAALLRQRVLHAHGRRGNHGPLDDALLFELLQPVAQHLVGDVGNEPRAGSRTGSATRAARK